METLGLRGWPLYLNRMPRAEARLLAMDDVSSREDGRRWPRSDGTCGRGFAAGCSVFEGSPVAEASFGSLGCFSSVVESASVSASVDCAAFSAGNLSSSESRRWCSSRSFSVRRASMQVVFWAAFENSPAARVCWAIATVVSAAFVAFEAARA